MRIYFAILFLIFQFSSNGIAQNSMGGIPFGVLESSLLEKIPAVQKRSEALQAEVNQSQEDPILFSKANDIQWKPDQTEWIRYNDRWIFFLSLEAPGAYGAGMILDQFLLEDEDRVFLYERSGTHILGAFRGADLRENTRFFPGLLKGEQWVIEVSRVRVQSPAEAPLRVARIDLVPGHEPVALGFDDALPCQINVACPEGAEYEDEQKSVVRILMVLKEGMGWCSGALLNNTSTDGTPYILTAFHCQDGYTPEYDLWRFDFNYQSETCAMPAQEPGRNTYTGALFRAGRRESDFLLLELTDEIMPGQDVWFSGWSYSTEVPKKGVLIHHPAGDIKKISFEDDEVVVQNASLKWNNGTITPRGFHFQAILDRGTMEPGSSGGPLFDQNGYIVGQLHGGNADCDTKFLTYHGRFMRSWPGGGSPESRLSDWLDPNGIDPVRFEGMGNPSQLPVVQVSGRVETAKGDPVSNVEVKIEGTVESTTLTSTDGMFHFYDLPAKGTYRITPNKSDFPQNGVTAQDVSIIRRHLLGITTILDPMALKAADTNMSGSVTAADVIPMIRLILGIAPEFPNRPSWMFYPESLELNELEQDKLDLNLKAIKTGDVNFSADPRL